MAAPAPCDGQREVSAQLNQALAAGGTVSLPAGLCVVSATLQVPSHTLLQGAGIGRTIIKAAAGLIDPVISVGGTTLATGSTDVDISALSVDGSATAAGPRGVGRPDGIRVPFGSSRVRLHDLEVSGAAANGIEVNGSDNVVEDSVVHDNYENGVYVIGKGNAGGLHVVPAAGVRVQHNRVYHNSLGKAPGSGHAWDGIDIDPISQSCTVQGNVVTGNDIIVLENAAVVPASSGHQVLDNVVQDSPGNGIVVQGPETDFSVAGNRIERITGWGIVLNGPVQRGEVRGNTISETTREGVLIKNTLPRTEGLTGPPRAIVVSANTIRLATSGPARIAVAARQGAREVRITDNEFLGVADPAGAVDVRFAAADVVVADNRR